MLSQLWLFCRKFHTDTLPDSDKTRLVMVMGFDDVAEQYQLGQYDEALGRLQYLHREWHAKPLEHVLIHYWQARIAVSQHRYRRALWEWFAMVFAAPTSLVQKHTGLVRKNI